MSKLSVKAGLERTCYIASRSTQALGTALTEHTLTVLGQGSNKDCREVCVAIVPGDEGEPIPLPE